MFLCSIDAMFFLRRILMYAIWLKVLGVMHEAYNRQWTHQLLNFLSGNSEVKLFSNGLTEHVLIPSCKDVKSNHENSWAFKLFCLNVVMLIYLETQIGVNKTQITYYLTYFILWYILSKLLNKRCQWQELTGFWSS